MVPEPNKEQEPMPTVEWTLWKHMTTKQPGISLQTEQQWLSNTQEMSHFFAHPTQQAFKINLHHLPKPSKSFFLKTSKNLAGEHRADFNHIEYSLFRDGIRPEWEEPECAGELYAKHYFPPALLDRYWQELAHGVMEGKIDNEHVCGIRILDKSKGKHPVYKLEIWLNTSKSDIRGKIRKQALECITQDENYRFNFHWREFSTPDSDEKQKEADPQTEGLLTTGQVLVAPL